MQSAANRRASLGPNNHPPAAETLQGGFSHQVDADRVASGQSASFSGRAAVPGNEWFDQIYLPALVSCQMAFAKQFGKASCVQASAYCIMAVLKLL